MTLLLSTKFVSHVLVLLCVFGTLEGRLHSDGTCPVVTYCKGQEESPRGGQGLERGRREYLRQLRAKKKKRQKKSSSSPLSPSKPSRGGRGGTKSKKGSKLTSSNSNNKVAVCVTAKRGKSSKELNGDQDELVTKCLEEDKFDREIKKLVVASCGCCPGEEDLCIKTPSPTVSLSPSVEPTAFPSEYPTDLPSVSSSPSLPPTAMPSGNPTETPSISPTSTPSAEPSSIPSTEPSDDPSSSTQPSSNPSFQPSFTPSVSVQPSSIPSSAPTQDCQTEVPILILFESGLTSGGTIAKTFPSTCQNEKTFPSFVEDGIFYAYAWYSDSSRHQPSSLAVCVRVALFFQFSTPHCSPSSFVVSAYLKESLNPLDLAAGAGYLGDSGHIDNMSGRHEFSFILPPGSDYDLVIFYTTPGSTVCWIDLNLLHDNQCRLFLGKLIK